MNLQNKHSQPFIIVLTITIVLVAASYFPTQLEWNGLITKKIGVVADIISKGKTKHVPLTQKINVHAVRKNTNEKNTNEKFANEKLAPIETESAKVLNFAADTSTSLEHFFNAINYSKNKSKKKKIRIAYFGDSMIEGDLISQDLRTCMQDLFGGDGVGFVPVTSIVAGFRKTILHTYGNWKTYTLLDTIPVDHPLGIAGYTFVPATATDFFRGNSDDSWVKYRAVNQKHLSKFYKTKLLYGKSTGENYVMINNTTYKLDGDKVVNALEIASKSPVSTINAVFKCETPLNVFGFTMESDTGAFVDNFSFRGNSGLSITKIKKAVYSATNDFMEYDLIILEYGLNAVSPAITNYSWYAKGMSRVINYMKSSFPTASILIISVGDKGYKDGEVYTTDPGVPFMVEMQRKMAEDNKVAFWSLYDAMGGSGSMVKWVEEEPAMANKDYTHFNFRGSHKVGKLLFNKLMDDYNAYNTKK